MSDIVVSYDGYEVDMLSTAMLIGVHQRELEDRGVYDHLKYVTDWAKSVKEEDQPFQEVLTVAMSRLGINANLDTLWLRVKTEEDFEKIDPTKIKKLPQWLKSNEKRKTLRPKEEKKKEAPPKEKPTEPTEEPIKEEVKKPIMVASTGKTVEEMVMALKQGTIV